MSFPGAPVTPTRYPAPVTATRTARLRLSLAFGTGLAACGGDLPVAERIATTRVLAVRSEVIGPLTPDDPELGPRCEALPFERVRLTPFVATPTGPLDLAGPDFDPVWIACNLGPGQGLFACLKSALPLKLADIPACPVPSFTDLDPTSMALPEPPSPCVLPADDSDDGVQDFTVPLASALLIGGDVEITMISRSPGSPDTAACAEDLLAGDSELPNDCLYAVQRVSVGPIERLLALAADFGVMLPPELGEPPPPEQIPDSDRNPRILDFSVVRVGPDGVGTDLGPQPRGAVIAADLGDTLKISTNIPEGDLQDFEVPINGGAGGSETQTETLDGSWFRSWGDLLANGSDDIMSIDDWTLVPGNQDEQQTPPDGRATLFYVVRDSRLGVDWWWISVEVPPSPAP